MISKSHFQVMKLFRFIIFLTTFFRFLTPNFLVHENSSNFKSFDNNPIQPVVDALLPGTGDLNDNLYFSANSEMLKVTKLGLFGTLDLSHPKFSSVKYL
jgi:hypothetical protein